MAPPSHVTRRCFRRGFYAATADSIMARRPGAVPLYSVLLHSCLRSCCAMLITQTCFRYQVRISIFSCYARFCLLCLFLAPVSRQPEASPIFRKWRCSVIFSLFQSICGRKPCPSLSIVVCCLFHYCRPYTMQLTEIESIISQQLLFHRTVGLRWKP